MRQGDGPPSSGDRGVERWKRRRDGEGSASPVGVEDAAREGIALEPPPPEPPPNLTRKGIRNAAPLRVTASVRRRRPGLSPPSERGVAMMLLPPALPLLRGVAVRLSPTPGVRRGEHTEGEEGGEDEAAEEAGEERGVCWLPDVEEEEEEGDMCWLSAVERDVG